MVLGGQRTSDSDDPGDPFGSSSDAAGLSGFSTERFGWFVLGDAFCSCSHIGSKYPMRSVLEVSSYFQRMALASKDIRATDGGPLGVGGLASVG